MYTSSINFTHMSLTRMYTRTHTRYTHTLTHTHTHTHTHTLTLTYTHTLTCTHTHTHMITLYSQVSIPRSFTNEDITVDLRYSAATVNARTCDINYLTVWCKSSQMHLSRIEIPASTFVRITTHPPIHIACIRTCTHEHIWKDHSPTHTHTVAHALMHSLLCM